MRGFFFIVIAFLFISYIFLSLYSIERILEVEQRQIPILFEAQEVNNIAFIFSDDNLYSATSLFTNYALYSMTEYNSNSSNSGFSNEQEVKDCFKELFVYGTCNKISYSEEDIRTKTLSGFLESLNSSLREEGYNLTHVDYSLDIYQENPISISVALNLYLNVTNNYGVDFNKNYSIVYKKSIDGLIDPGVTREMHKLGLEGERQIWLSQFSTASSLAPSLVKNGLAGQGWFYGPLVYVDQASSIPEEERSKYILVGTYDDIVNYNNYADFGAYILTNQPVIEYEGDCKIESSIFNALVEEETDDGCNETTENKIYKPFIVIKGFSRSGSYLINSKVTPSSVVSNPSLKWSSNPSLYFIESLRGVVACAQYVPSTRAPSYLQRFVDNYYLLDSPYGIATFLMNRDFAEFDRSSLDYEFFNSIAGTKIKGAPGCKSYSQCTSASPIGHFNVEDYNQFNLDNILCGDC